MSTYHYLQMRLAYELFKESRVIEEFNLDERVLAHFVANVASNYHSNPYHNFTHAIYVLQATFLILEVCQQHVPMSRTVPDHSAATATADCPHLAACS